ncbi:MAG: general secretion pathway protein GspE [Desulfovibrio sp.]|nr:MAG: general secretion pathway protein GspE [Desulfovibrio sp.]
MLVDAGLLSREQLEGHLAGQRQSGQKLGQYLIRHGVFEENQIVDLISRQLRIKKYHPDRFSVDQDVKTFVPSEMAQRFSLVPLSKRKTLLLVAMVDPMDISALDALEETTNLEVETIICTEQELAELTYAVYGITSDLDEVMERMEEMDVDAQEVAEVDAPIEDVTVSSLQDMAEEAPVIRLVNSIFAQAVRDGASDIHISPEKNYVQMRFRVDGKLKEVPAPPKTIFLPIVSRIKILSGMDIAVSRVPQDGRFTFKLENREIHVRASSLPTIYGENLVLRLLLRGARTQTLQEIGLRDADRLRVEETSRKPYGMILSTGPTGSGKSTTLYAIITLLNKPDINIVTLEDPVEYRVERVRQVQLNRKAGMTFASGLRSILRQDPDVVMVGEIRDGETANIAVQAAMTGHKLLSTLHTNNSPGAITRLLEMGIEPFLISSTLLVSIAQRLVRIVCPKCKEEYQPAKDLVKLMGLEGKKNISFQRGKGCHACHNSGYAGRTGIFEVLVNDEDVQDMIMRRASSNEILKAAMQKKTFRTLKMDALEKVARGLTTLEEAAGAVML